MAATLSIDFISKLGEGAYNFPSRHLLEWTQMSTSITSSLMGGGMGSPFSFKLSRYT
jgi:hypothetical protein